MKHMLLQHAIILGDTLKKCDPWMWISEDGSCGCALGGALLATGVTTNEFGLQAAGTDLNDMDKFAELPCIIARWPWLTAVHVVAISELYFKVQSGTKTIEDVADYVRSIEPAEESTLPDLPLSEQLRLEEEAAAEEGAAIEASGYPDPAENVRFA